MRRDKDFVEFVKDGIGLILACIILLGLVFLFGTIFG